MAQRNGFITGKNIAYDFEPFFNRRDFMRDAETRYLIFLVLQQFRTEKNPF
jgi:hypothetical protein